MERARPGREIYNSAWKRESLAIRETYPWCATRCGRPAVGVDHPTRQPLYWFIGGRFTFADVEPKK